jgi:hypothetical protein
MEAKERGKEKVHALPQTETTAHTNDRGVGGRSSKLNRGQSKMGPTRKRPTLYPGPNVRSLSAIEMAIVSKLETSHVKRPQVAELRSLENQGIPDEYEASLPPARGTQDLHNEDEIPPEEEEKTTASRAIPCVSTSGGLTSLNELASDLSKLAKPRRAPKKSELEAQAAAAENKEGAKTQLGESKTWGEFEHLKRGGEWSEGSERSTGLKASKSPDPFEAQHIQNESQLQGLISNTSSPDNPLYHLRQSGSDSQATQRAYRHFVISLFESIVYVKEMKETPESLVLETKQNVKLPRPVGLKCNVGH